MYGPYINDPTLRYPPTRLLKMIPGCAMFRLLESILDPTKTPPRSLQDIVIICIDLEFTEIPDRRCISQLGVATLDTRCLSSIDIGSAQELETAVRGRCFSVSTETRRVSRRCKKSMFMWGPAESITMHELRARLKEMLYDDPNISPRNVVLVGHGIRNDRRVLMNNIGLDVKDVPSIKAILDTGRMFCNAYDFGISSHDYFPLSSILRCLGIHYARLHNAGNDAMFTLKALLLMFTNWKGQMHRCSWNLLDQPALDPAESIDDVQEGLLWNLQIQTLTATARAPWPDTSKLAPRKIAKHQRQVRICRDDPVDSQDMMLEDLFGLTSKEID